MENRPAGKSPHCPAIEPSSGPQSSASGSRASAERLDCRRVAAQSLPFCPGRVVRTQQSLQSPIRRAYQRVMDQATVPVSRAPSLPGPGLPEPNRPAPGRRAPSVRTPARATVVPWTTRPWPPTWPSSTTLAAPRAARPSPPSASAPAWSPTIRPEPPPNKARSPATCSALTTARGEPQAAPLYPAEPSGLRAALVIERPDHGQGETPRPHALPGRAVRLTPESRRAHEIVFVAPSSRSEGHHFSPR